MKVDWKKISVRDLAAVVSKKLTERKIDAVLVGGACVSIYTKNRYLSYDLDFVSHATLKEISNALSELGFARESSRHFVRKDCPFFIEFVAPPLSIGDEPVKDREKIRTIFGSVVLLTPTDSVKDRLAAFYHWNDSQALDQAVLVATARKVNLREIRRWSDREGHLNKYNAFMKLLKS
jgi:hypothetical protein